MGCTMRTLRFAVVGLVLALTACPEKNCHAPLTYNLWFSERTPNIYAGAPFTVQVGAEDEFGGTAVGFQGPITIAIGANPAGGTLSGTATVAAGGTYATFPNLSIDKVGTGYTLTASAPGASGTTTDPFSVMTGGHGTPTQLVFTVQPSIATVGQAISPAVVVSVLDPFGSTVTDSTFNVTVHISVNVSGATLSGTTTVATVNGVATFSDLSLSKAGVGFVLEATCAGLLTASTGGFTVN
jgi:hypothetical protein